jgi:hypothetical protein
MRAERLILPEAISIYHHPLNQMYVIDGLDRLGPLGSIRLNSRYLYSTPGFDRKQGRTAGMLPRTYFWGYNGRLRIQINNKYISSACLSRFMKVLDAQERFEMEEALPEILDLLNYR